MKSNKRTAIRVTGKVQGVFYRRDAAREGTRLGLSGFVRNEPDGSVYAEAEGTETAVGTFIHWCRRGPEHAWVEGVTVEELPPLEPEGAPRFHARY